MISMRVQHNIAAMNSYRNYNNNTKSINRNLEKLSSGYKINRAGDDAAGLAISEKMRAQITGLEGAQKNAKDGISLVQTAEGALTEVHSMLNRMASLAEQSANGTYDNETDRDQLQKEVSQLRQEIDRIADSANFNGIQLLNGDMSAEGGHFVTYKGVESTDRGTFKPTAATQELDTVTFPASYTPALASGDKVSVEITYRDSGNALQTYTVDFTYNSSNKFVTDDSLGNDADLGKSLKDVIDKRGGTLYDTFNTIAATAASGSNAATMTFKATEKGADKGQLVSLNINVNGVAQGASNVARSTNARDEYVSVKAADLGSVYNGSGVAADSVFEVEGHRFVFATSGNLNAFDSDVNVIQVGGTSVAAGDMANIAGTINRVVGRDVATANGVNLEFSTNAGQALRLQIGDTADSYNQLDVSISDMHASALGIGGIDISSQSGAANAMAAIKTAINKVSDVRGTLGATQNRLDHTINNLSVMQENIQDAESTIRDTDVADEMMKYTKNSILVQSAQAMLAQANQQPQGVLQLLQ
jgi:flagellin